MSVPASKVKSVCNRAEIALVRASRQPDLERHSPAELRRLAGRARKEFDKWQGLSRGQSRTRSRQVGSGKDETNTDLKTEIFRDALRNFEVQLAKVTATAMSPGKTSQPSQSKRVRSTGHRAGRKEVRNELNQARLRANKPRKTSGAAKKQTVAAAPAVATPPPAAAVAVSAHQVATKPAAGATKKKKPSTALTGRIGITKSTQCRAIAAAKKSRVERGGLSTRVRGHVSARGKRRQARRDAKN